MHKNTEKQGEQASLPTGRSLGYIFARHENINAPELQNTSKTRIMIYENKAQ